MKLGHDLEMPVYEKDFTLSEVYTADEAFVTGTFAGMIPVREVDGRVIGSGGRGPWTAKLQEAYVGLCDREAARGRYRQMYG
jgi:branched-chain amino acid aminotransferase